MSSSSTFGRDLKLATELPSEGFVTRETWTATMVKRLCQGIVGIMRLLLRIVNSVGGKSIRPPLHTTDLQILQKA